MKKLLALIIIAALMTVAIAACGDSGTEPSGGDTTPVTTPSGGGNDSTPANGGGTDPTPQQTDAFDADRIIGVYTREDGSGTRGAFVDITGVGDDMYVEAVVLTATAEIRTNVAENLYGIGYVSLGSLNDTVKALDIGGIKASTETVLDGTYPISRPFIIMTNDENDGDELVQDFINFALSATGQEMSSTSWISPIDGAPEYQASGLSGTLKIGGSTSVDPLMQLLAAEYKALNSDVNIEISGGGSGVGISEAIDGIVNIGMSSRELRDSEKPDLNEYVIALDGVAVIVNKDNPVDGMDMETVKNIFIGEMTKWSEIIG
ncbi:MAG: substrate-binding domain-containing protein [Oscillospiraceae bacterium]|nr:substrate-binding domain-containing protein [Oscillospiraceae bacterium]